jgi:hypothetical protein
MFRQNYNIAVKNVGFMITFRKQVTYRLRSRLMCGRCLVRISDGSSAILTVFAWLFPVLPVECRTITSQRPLPLPSKSFPFHQSFYHSTLCSVKSTTEMLRRGRDFSKACCFAFCRLR